MNHYYPNSKYKNENDYEFPIIDYMEYSNTYVRPYKLISAKQSWFLTGLIWDVFDNPNGDVFKDGALVDYH